MVKNDFGSQAIHPLTGYEPDVFLIAVVSNTLIYNLRIYGSFAFLIGQSQPYVVFEMG